MTPEELARRRPVWEAMSDLFLDTEVRWNVPYVARACAESGYDAATLERVFWREVFPEAIGNLLQVAGEWGLLSLPEAALVRRAEADEEPRALRLASGWMVESEWRAALALVPWLGGADALARQKALDVLGWRYFEEPGGKNGLATPARARESAALLREAWARYAPLCETMLIGDERGSHAARVADVEALISLGELPAT